MTLGSDTHQESDVPEEPFEIVSTTYKWFLWIVLVSILAMDFIALANWYMNGSNLSLLLKVIALLGVGLKLAILGFLVAKKGPIEPFIYVWGGLMLVSAITGLLSFVVSGEPTPTHLYLNKFVFLALGLGLVAPVSRSIQRAQASD
jgi:hypothetical protein